MFPFLIVLFTISSGLNKECEEKVDEITLYPTLGEFFSNPLSNLFEGNNLRYHLNLSIGNVEVKNVLNLISSVQGHNFKSLSSNNTHFAALTTSQQIIIYYWNNQSMSQIKIHPIHPIFECQNIILCKKFNTYLVDCYKKNQINLVQYQNDEIKTVYQFQSQSPLSTKMKELIYQRETFLLYAQYYNNYSILTLFSSNYTNITYLSYNFIDFDLSKDEDNSIYLLCSSNIYQLIISENYTFQYINNSNNQVFSKSPYNGIYSDNYTLTAFQIYNSLNIFAQCNQIVVNYVSQQENSDLYYLMLLCNNTQVLISYQIKDLQVGQIYFNDEFMIVYNQSQLNVYRKNFLLFTKIYQNVPQIYFNSENNQLFLFGSTIQIYELSIPALNINLTNQITLKNNTQFYVFAQENIEFKFLRCKVFVTIQQLNKDDTNIYVMFSQVANYFNIRQVLLLIITVIIQISLSLIHQINFFNLLFPNQFYMIIKICNSISPLLDTQIIRLFLLLVAHMVRIFTCFNVKLFNLLYSTSYLQLKKCKFRILFQIHQFQVQKKLIIFGYIILSNANFQQRFIVSIQFNNLAFNKRQQIIHQHTTVQLFC